MHIRLLTIISIAIGLAVCQPSTAEQTAADSKTKIQSPSTNRVSTKPYILHLPGIAGEAPVDHTLINGFADLGAEVVIHDWTEKDSGIHALQAMERNKKQAALIAADLTKRYRQNPTGEIFITCHSGGAGIAAWTLEALPADVKITRLIFLAPALSPDYDLSKALAHVTDKAYCFWSDRDTVVLSVGTKTFGTIDGLYTNAAGYVGFKKPAGGDEEQYKKLLQYPYDPTWVKFYNSGDHLGTMTTEFSKGVIVPIIKKSEDRLPDPVKPATR